MITGSKLPKSVLGSRDMHCSTPQPPGASSPAQNACQSLSHLAHLKPCPTPHLWYHNLAPEWPDDRMAHQGGRWPQEARADKTHCPDTHVVKSQLSLDFMASESMLGSKAIAVSCFCLFLCLSFSLFYP